MSNYSCHQKTEMMAQKHGKASNQKSNFKYLMKGKTDRVNRQSHRSKENQIESVLLNSSHKYALKTARVKTVIQESQPLISPITSFDVFLGHSQTQQSEITHNQLPLESLEHITMTQSPSLILGREQIPEEESLKKVERCQLKCNQQDEKNAQFACMTEECYYTKELEIKIQLLQKERDNIWNSISQTMKENMTLKEIISNFTINKKTTISTESQSDFLATLEQQVQTDITSDEIAFTQLQNNKYQCSINQAKQFCLNVVQNFDNSKEESQQLTILISKTIDTTIDRLTNQWMDEKELLQKLHEQQIQKYEAKIKDNIESMTKLIQEGKEKDKIRRNIEKIYQKEFEDINVLVSTKQKRFAEEIDKIKDQIAKIQDSHQQQKNICLQYVQNANNSWNQKQRLYSVLMSEAHKTIKNLMNQMKEFENLANENYSKYLKSQKSQNVWKIVKDQL